MQGTLEKRASGKKALLNKWNSRYFVLEKSLLKYSKSKGDAKCTEIDLTSYDIVPALPGELRRNDNILCLFHPTRRVYFLQAPSAVECEKWTKALRDAMTPLSTTLKFPSKPIYSCYVRIKETIGFSIAFLILTKHFLHVIKGSHEKIQLSQDDEDGENQISDSNSSLQDDKSNQWRSIFSVPVCQLIVSSTTYQGDPNEANEEASTSTSSTSQPVPEDSTTTASSLPKSTKKLAGRKSSRSLIQKIGNTRRKLSISRRPAIEVSISGLTFSGPSFHDPSKLSSLSVFLDSSEASLIQKKVDQMIKTLPDASFSISFDPIIPSSKINSLTLDIFPAARRDECAKLYAKRPKFYKESFLTTSSHSKEGVFYYFKMKICDSEYHFRRSWFDIQNLSEAMALELWHVPWLPHSTGPKKHILSKFLSKSDSEAPPTVDLLSTSYLFSWLCEVITPETITSPEIQEALLAFLDVDMYRSCIQQDFNMFFTLLNSLPKGSHSKLFGKHTTFKETCVHRLCRNVPSKTTPGLKDLLELIISTDPKSLRLSDSNGDTPLHGAITCQNFEIIETILSLGCQPGTPASKSLANICNKKKETPLHRAINVRNLAIIKILFKKGNADIKSVDSRKNTVMHMIFIPSTLNNNTPDDPENILNIVKFFLKKGASSPACLNSQNSTSHTPLFTLIRNNPDPTIFSILLDCNPDLTIIDKKTGNPIFHFAIQNQSVDIITLLIEYFKKQTSPDSLTKFLSIRNTSQDSFLHTAVKVGNMKILRLLKPFLHVKVKSPKAESHPSEVTPLRYRGHPFPIGDISSKKLLPLIDSPNPLGKSPIFYTSITEDTISTQSKSNLSQNSSAILKWLLENGANPNSVSIYQSTPLHVASSLGLASDCLLLLSHGAKLVLDAFKRSCLHLAIEYDSLSSIPALVKYSIDVNETDILGYSPLHLAISLGNWEAVKTMLYIGAAVDTKSKEFGYTPLSLSLVSNWTSSVSKNDRNRIIDALLKAADIAVYDVNDTAGLNPLQLLIHHFYSSPFSEASGSTSTESQVSSEGGATSTSSSDAELIPSLDVDSLHSRFLESVSLLLQNDIDLEAKNASGHTILWKAVEQKDHKLIRLLASFGANFDIQDDQEVTLLDLAETVSSGRILRKFSSRESTLDLVSKKFHCQSQKCKALNTVPVSRKRLRCEACDKLQKDRKKKSRAAAAKVAGEEEIPHLLQDEMKMAAGTKVRPLFRIEIDATPAKIAPQLNSVALNFALKVASPSDTPTLESLSKTVSLSTTSISSVSITDESLSEQLPRPIFSLLEEMSILSPVKPNLLSAPDTPNPFLGISTSCTSIIAKIALLKRIVKADQDGIKNWLSVLKKIIKAENIQYGVILHRVMKKQRAEQRIRILATQDSRVDSTDDRSTERMKRLLAIEADALGISEEITGPTTRELSETIFDEPPEGAHFDFVVCWHFGALRFTPAHILVSTKKATPKHFKTLLKGQSTDLSYSSFPLELTPDSLGFTSIHAIVLFRRLDLLEYVISSYGKQNDFSRLFNSLTSQGWSVLTISILSSWKEGIKLLSKSIPDSKWCIPDFFGFTPLDYAQYFYNFSKNEPEAAEVVLDITETDFHKTNLTYVTNCCMNSKPQDPKYGKKITTTHLSSCIDYLMAYRHTLKNENSILRDLDEHDIKKLFKEPSFFWEQISNMSYKLSLPSIDLINHYEFVPFCPEFLLNRTKPIQEALSQKHGVLLKHPIRTEYTVETNSAGISLFAFLRVPEEGFEDPIAATKLSKSIFVKSYSLDSSTLSSPKIHNIIHDDRPDEVSLNPSEYSFLPADSKNSKYSRAIRIMTENHWSPANFMASLQLSSYISCVDTKNTKYLNPYLGFFWSRNRLGFAFKLAKRGSLADKIGPFQGIPFWDLTLSQRQGKATLNQTEMGINVPVASDFTNDPEKIFKIMIDIIAGLLHLHNKMIHAKEDGTPPEPFPHGALSLSNIVHDGSHWQLTDYAINLWCNDPDSFTAKQIMDRVINHACYIAPEQFVNLSEKSSKKAKNMVLLHSPFEKIPFVVSQSTCESDIYALGIILLQLAHRGPVNPYPIDLTQDIRLDGMNILERAILLTGTSATPGNTDSPTGLYQHPDQPIPPPIYEKLPIWDREVLNPSDVEDYLAFERRRSRVRTSRLLEARIKHTNDKLWNTIDVENSFPSAFDRKGLKECIIACLSRKAKHRPHITKIKQVVADALGDFYDKQSVTRR